MKQYISAFLSLLAIVFLATAQAAAPNAPADTTKASVTPVAAAKTADAKPDTAKVETPETITEKNEKQAPSGLSEKEAPSALAGAASALSKPDSMKALTSGVAPKTAAPAPAKIAAPSLAKPDSAKRNAPSAPPSSNAPASRTQPAPLVMTPAPSTINADTAQAALPLLPPMRNAITLEKEVTGNPDGVIPRPKAAPGAPGSSSSSPAQGGAVPPSLPPAGASSGKADSSAVAVLPPQKKDQQPAPGAGAAIPGQPNKPRKSDTFREELTLFNSPTGNLRTMKVVIDDQYNLVGMAYGEEVGFLRIVTADNSGNFTETWKSPPLNSGVRGVFVDNLDNTGEAEIVAYTEEGNIFIFGYDTHEQKYKTPDGTYLGITCMLIANVDNSPEKELLFITKAGKMVQFDAVTRFEEWTSTETYSATDMVLGNVDNDSEIELVLNTGEVMNLRYKSVEWKMEGILVSQKSRLYLMDVDNDGILELIVQYDQSFTRIIDVDQRREKW